MGDTSRALSSGEIHSLLRDNGIGLVFAAAAAQALVAEDTPSTSEG